MKKLILVSLLTLSFAGSAFAGSAYTEQCSDTRGTAESTRLMNICYDILGQGAPCIESSPCEFITEAITLECRKTPVADRPAACVEFTGKQ